MTRIAKSLMALAAGLSVLSAGPALAQTEDVRTAVEAGNREWLAAFLRGDSQAIGNLYTTAAQAFPPQGEVVRGREAIARMWQGVIDSGVKGVTLTTLEVEASGATAYEVGTYSLAGDGGKVLDAGKYVVVWKREDGRWKLHRDIWNTSLPPSKP
jgi:uncharacterized protein (TIGR02246 family)